MCGTTGIEGVQHLDAMVLVTRVEIIHRTEVCPGAREPLGLEDQKMNRSCSNVQWLDAMEMVTLRGNIYLTEGQGQIN